ncbi:MAG: hypothetical protein PHC34_09480 [Candidatus Gastranaerophilales bacterium]|nr:hypothetical protein [Candidatus Gastranaerophilales bacterium]
MKKVSKSIFLLLAISFLSLNIPSFAKNSDPPKSSHISGRTVGAAALSLIVWPGIGQAVNNDKGEKVLTHALIGILPPYRFWSAYDALVDRKGGYWKGRI